MLSFDIGSAATLERRLARMKRLGVVVQARSEVDRRNVELKLSPKTWRTFQRYSARSRRAITPISVSRTKLASCAITTKS